MEAVTLVLLLAALGLLANRRGYDSRPGHRSAEHTLAALGHAWGEVERPAPADRPIHGAPERWPSADARPSGPA
jgi:hypothetical protein